MSQLGIKITSMENDEFGKRCGSPLIILVRPTIIVRQSVLSSVAMCITFFNQSRHLVLKSPEMIIKKSL